MENETKIVTHAKFLKIEGYWYFKGFTSDKAEADKFEQDNQSAMKVTKVVALD